MTAVNPPDALQFTSGDHLSTDYANLVRVSHSPLELVLEFARMLPGEDRAEVFERVVMSPLGAKLLLRALQENITRYETAFGEITVPAPTQLAQQLFKSNPPQE